MCVKSGILIIQHLRTVVSRPHGLLLKPQTVQTLLTAASRRISDNAVTDSVTR